MLTALRGAIGFLTRFPVGHDERAWDAFRSRPVTFPLVGYLLGGLVTLPLLAPVPPATAAIAFVAWLYALTGINHLDGVADIGDAAVVHGDRERRRAVLADTTVGVGAGTALAIVVVGLWSGGFALATRPVRALGIVIAAEVGSKCAVVMAAAFGSASHDGLGAAFSEHLDPTDARLPMLVTLPGAALTWPYSAAAVALAAAVFTAGPIGWWATRRLGGIDGDAFGATAELARVVGLHAGVIAWTLS